VKLLLEAIFIGKLQAKAAATELARNYVQYIRELGNYCGSVWTSWSLLAALLLHLHPGIAKKLFHRLVCR